MIVVYTIVAFASGALLGLITAALMAAAKVVDRAVETLDFSRAAARGELDFSWEDPRRGFEVVPDSEPVWMPLVVGRVYGSNPGHSVRADLLDEDAR